jgi:Cu-Zn family superoxide dismutase
MEPIRVILAGATAVALTASVLLGQTGGHRVPTVAAQGAQATAVLRDLQGNQVGMVSFTELPSGKVMVQADVMNLPPGFHGFHVHATGVCDPATNFNSAGGHFQKPGHMGAHPDHSGDLPSLYVSTDGSGVLMVHTDRFTFEDLFTGGQRALIIHADKDNFAHFPERYGITPDETTLNTGDAGGRIACGVIERN